MVKFGKLIRKSATPGWADKYINYKELKKLIKYSLSIGDWQATEWDDLLLVELRKVNDFYKSQETFIIDELKELHQVADVGTDDGVLTVTTDLAARFSDFCRMLELLRSFVLLNYSAVNKIVKKRNKKLNRAPVMEPQAVLMEQPFYTSLKLALVTVRTELLALKFSPNQPIKESNYTCSICIQVLCNPVVLSCTHRFCFACISQTAIGMESCPECRKKGAIKPEDFRVDWILKEFLVENFPQTSQDNTALVEHLKLLALDIPQDIKELNEKKELKEQELKKGNKEPQEEFVLKRKLGNGVFGEVYYALQGGDEKKPFALKKISKRNENYREIHTQMEIEAGNRLRSDKIVQFFGSFETADDCFLILEYFNGLDFFSVMRMRNFRPPPEKHAVRIIRQVIDALLHAQENLIAHRDIKLDNILITQKVEVKLIDWGLCFIAPKADFKTPCCEGVVGSRYYIAPEILLGKKYSPFASDMFSLGVSLFAILFGRFPFSEDQLENELMQGVMPTISWETRGRPVSYQAQEILLSMLAVRPERRFTLAELARHPWIQGEGLTLLK